MKKLFILPLFAGFFFLFPLFGNLTPKALAFDPQCEDGAGNPTSGNLCRVILGDNECCGEAQGWVCNWVTRYYCVWGWCVDDDSSYTYEGHDPCVLGTSCNPNCKTCNYNRTYNQCCAEGLSQRVDEYVWSDGSGVCNYVTGSCNQSDPACVTKTCNYNRTYSQCCAEGLSQKVDEYVWSDGSGVCNYITGSCNQSDPACGGPVTPTPPPPPPPPPDGIACNYDEVSLSVSPNPSLVGQTVNFTISGDASTWISDSWSGGVTGCGGPWNSKTCTANSAGNFSWTHTWKKCVGDIDNCSPTCSESAPFTILPPPVTCTVTLSPPSQNFYVGQTGQITALVTMSDGSSPDGKAQQIDFTGYNASLITLNPDPRSSPPPYSTTVAAAGLSGGTTNVSATVTLTNGNTCSAPSVQVAVLTPTCTVSLSPNPLNLFQGDSGTLYATVVTTPPGTSITRVAFSSDSLGIATVNPGEDSSPAYSTQVTAVSPSVPASTTIRATTYIGPGGVWSCPSPPATATVNVAPPPAWFQTGGGDVHVEGNLVSRIPTFSNTDPYFSLTLTGSSPGVVSANGSADFVPGSVSSPGWLLEDYRHDEYSSTNRYDYEYFDQRISSVPLPVSNPSFPDRNQLANLADGSYKATGDVTLQNPINSTWTVGANQKQKITLLIDGNLTIRGRIKVSKGFLAIIVRGNIVMDGNYVSDQTNPATEPGVEGIYISNGQIDTGLNTDLTKVFLGRGSFVAHGGFNLQRQSSNPSTIPAEKFTYSPDIVMEAQQELLSTPFIWQEVAP